MIMLNMPNNFWRKHFLSYYATVNDTDNTLAVQCKLGKRYVYLA